MRIIVGILVVLFGLASACGDDSSAGDVADEAAADADLDADVAGETAGDHGASESVAMNAPICEDGVSWNTRRRWVDPVSGYNYCDAACRGCTAECRNDGTADEGWYTVCSDPSADADCGDLPGLIGRGNCM